MPYVLDASITISWLMPDEENEVAEQAYTRLSSDHALVPALWGFEIRNVLLSNERRGRLDNQKTRQALALLAELPIRVDDTKSEASLLQLARRHRLTVYDAAYLELAQRERIPLATLNAALANAGRAEKVRLVGE